MAQILVRDLDASVVDRLKSRAAHHRRSLQAEAKLILEQATRLDAAAARQLAEDIRARLSRRGGEESTEIVRQSRDH
jgi:plasmid stability protein